MLECNEMEDTPGDGEKWEHSKEKLKIIHLLETLPIKYKVKT